MHDLWIMRELSITQISILINDSNINTPSDHLAWDKEFQQTLILSYRCGRTM